MKAYITIIALLFIFNSAMAQSSFSSDKQTAEDNIMIYPNPVTDSKFYVNAEETVISVEVMNVIGQSIKIVKNNTQVPYNILVELPECKNGMYLVRVTTQDNKSFIKKILIK